MEKQLFVENIMDFGTLYFEHTLLKLNSDALLFICSDKDGQLYLCNCSEMRGKFRYVIVKTDINTISELINLKITIFDAFFNGYKFDNAVIVEISTDNITTSKLIKKSEISESDLPNKGTLLRYFNEDQTLIFIENYKKFNK